jgi:hypothetical protein
MISNERRSPYSHSSYGSGNQTPRIADTVLISQELQVERKTFMLAVRENPRGRILRITEGIGARRNNIIIPATGLAEFTRVFDEMTRAASEIPEGQPQNRA